MFVCCFHPAEFRSLKGKDVAPKPHAALNLLTDERTEWSKTGLADQALLLDAEYGDFLEPAPVWLAGHRTGCKLFSCDYNELKRSILGAWERLGLGIRFVLYQLRHGGPSHDHYYRARDLSGGRARGQWQSDTGVHRYGTHARHRSRDNFPQLFGVRRSTHPSECALAFLATYRKVLLARRLRASPQFGRACRRRR